MVPNPKPEKKVKIATKKATKEMMIRSIGKLIFNVSRRTKLGVMIYPRTELF